MDKRDLLQSVARVLLEKEVMEGDELRALMGLSQTTDQTNTATSAPAAQSTA